MWHYFIKRLSRANIQRTLMQMQAPLPSYATKVPRWAILPSALTVVVASTNASLSYALHGLLMSLIITLDNVAAVHCAKSRYNTVKKRKEKKSTRNKAREQHSPIRHGMPYSRRGNILMYVAGCQSIMSNMLGRITAPAYIMDPPHIFMTENSTLLGVATLLSQFFSQTYVMYKT